MEPITQGLLGAAMGELAAGRALGRRALFWGALVGMSPDLDVLLAPLHDGFGEWLYHRGTTHALWFGLVAGPPLGLALRRWQDRAGRTPPSAWIALAVAALVTHPLLDGFTPYGTQLLAPFSRERFVWNGVAIVDPFYSAILALGVWRAAARRRPAAARSRAIVACLTLGCVYLGLGVGLNGWMERDVRDALARSGGVPRRINVYPTAFQPWLRHFVAHRDERVLTGFTSVLRPGCPSWTVRRAPGADPRTRVLLDTWEGRLFAWFADGELGLRTRTTSDGVRIRIDDLRYTWGNGSAEGLWGIEAEIDDHGELRGEVRRFGRGDAGLRDAGPFLAAVLGLLPGAEAGWHRPPGCDAEGHGGRHDRLPHAEDASG